MNKYIVIATVDVVISSGLSTRQNMYAVTVEANSNGSAEHKLLDLGECVKYAQAFGRDEIKTDTFTLMIMEAETISLELFQSNVALQDEIQGEILDLRNQAAELIKKAEELKKKANNRYADMQNIW